MFHNGELRSAFFDGEVAELLVCSTLFGPRTLVRVHIKSRLSHLMQPSVVFIGIYFTLSKCLLTDPLLHSPPSLTFHNYSIPQLVTSNPQCENLNEGTGSPGFDKSGRRFIQVCSPNGLHGGHRISQVAGE